MQNNNANTIVLFADFDIANQLVADKIIHEILQTATITNFQQLGYHKALYVWVFEWACWDDAHKNSFQLLNKFLGEYFSQDYFLARKNNSTGELFLRGKFPNNPFGISIDFNKFEILYEPPIDARRKKFMQWVQVSLEETLRNDVASVFTAGMVDCKLDAVMNTKEMEEEIDRAVLAVAGKLVGYY